MLGDFNSDGVIDFSDFSVMGNIVTGFGQLPNIDIRVNTSDGPKCNWLVKYYDYNVVNTQETYLGEHRISDSIYGNISLPSEIAKYKYITIKSTVDAGGGGYDILTDQDDPVGKTYKAIVLSSELPNMNWSIHLTVISTLLYESLPSGVSTQEFDTLYHSNKTILQTALGIDDMYKNPYSTLTEKHNAVSYVAAGIKLSIFINVIEKASSGNSNQSHVLNALSNILLTDSSVAVSYTHLTLPTKA